MRGRTALAETTCTSSRARAGLDPGSRPARRARAVIIGGLLDGAGGPHEGVSNMPTEAGTAAWKQHYDKLDQIAGSVR